MWMKESNRADVLGKMHMSTVKIGQDELLDDDCEICINSGICSKYGGSKCEIRVKTASILEQVAWTNALVAAMSEYSPKRVRREKNDVYKS